MPSTKVRFHLTLFEDKCSLTSGAYSNPRKCHKIDNPSTCRAKLMQASFKWYNSAVRQKGVLWRYSRYRRVDLRNVFCCSRSPNASSVFWPLVYCFWSVLVLQEWAKTDTELWKLTIRTCWRGFHRRWRIANYWWLWSLCPTFMAM